MKNFFILALCACYLPGFAQTKPSIIPQPKSKSDMPGPFTLNEKTVISSSPSCMNEALYFKAWLENATGKTFKVYDNSEVVIDENVIVFFSGDPIDFNETLDSYKTNPLPNVTMEMLRDNSEQYKLIVIENSIIVSANQPAGIFYSIQTLKQLLPIEAETGKLKLPFSINGIMIEDEPAFRHRGLMLDCCRHFMDVAFIKKYIDLLALYKMNVFHWHLTEDQGWRIQIEKYPLLTEVGAWRKEADGSVYGGFYTKDEIRDVVQYATERHITIIPEIELPGHCTAAIAAYPWLSCTGDHIEVENEWGVFKDIYCAGNDSVFNFLEDILTEVCELFPGPYIHIGGDEVPKYRWEHCDKCQARMRKHKLQSEAELQSYFINRISKFLTKKGKKIIGWDEILEGGIPSDALVQSWRGMEGGMEAANDEHFVIVSPTSHCYFDYSLESIDMEKVYSFNPIPDSIPNAARGFIIGGECNMWTEHAPQEKVDSKVFPRMLALAEVLWSNPTTQVYSSFRSRVQSQYPRLDALKVDYGFESVPVEIKNTTQQNGTIKLEVNKKYPVDDSKIICQFVTSENKNDTSWFQYTSPLIVTTEARLKVKVEKRGKQYDREINRSYAAHKALNQKLVLNYEPSPSYTGGGRNALVDGALGTNSFRDGVWQAVQGKNIEAQIDLGAEQTITSISTHWFHYANAWIFRPENVEYLISSDGKKWEKVYEGKTDIEANTPGEFATEISVAGLSKSARFIKMKATSIGPCPEWHDAVGEPSWLFCDEIIVR